MSSNRFIAHFAREKTIPIDEYQAMKDLLTADPQIGSLVIDRSEKRANVYNGLRTGETLPQATRRL